jgi:DNA-binding LacI/PurR family transcriptional regulator
MQDVARRAMVSTTTVSHVLNGTRRVSDEVVHRVMAAIADLRYQPDEMARALRRQATETIGLLVPNLTTPLPSAILRDLEPVADRAGMGMIVASSRNVAERESHWLRTFRAKKLNSVLVWPIQNDRAPLTELVELGQPVIQIVAMVPGVTAPALVANFESAGRLGVEHLIGHGHRQILAVCGQSTYHQRALGGGRQVGSVLDGSVRLDSIDVGADPRAELPRVRAHLERYPAPTAILALSASAIEATLLTARSLGLTMGRDLAVVALSDQEWLDFTSPPVTAVRHDSRGIARMAADLVMRSLGGEQLRPYQVTFEPILHVGGSCGCATPTPDPPT